MNIFQMRMEESLMIDYEVPYVIAEIGCNHNGEI